MPRPKRNRIRAPDDTRSGVNAYIVCGLCALLLLAVGAIYGQTLGHILLDYDDNIFVYGNSHVAPGLTADGLHWAFTDGPGGEWYPLAMLSHMLDCQIFGVKAWGHHLTNLLLHAATSIALLLICWRMTGELWPSAFVAAIFAVHPQHVESVAWVAERKDVLSGLFFVLALGAYLGYVRRGRALLWYLLTAVLFSLALLAKPMAVTLPPLLLLLDFWPLARFGRAIDTPDWTRAMPRPGLLWLVLEKLPLVALAAVDGLMTLRTHTRAGEGISMEARLGNAAVSCLSYLDQFFCPVELAAFYPFPPGGPPLWKVAAAVTILLAVSAGAVIWRRRCPYLFVGWFWYLGTLSPVLGLVKMAYFSMADRYMYLPSVGFSIALTWGIARLVAPWPQARWASAAAAGLSIVVLTACAIWQTSLWRDDETLWRHALTCTTDNGEAECGLADALVRRGALEEALPYYRRAVQHAIDFTPFNNLGLLLGRLNQVDEAATLFRRATQIEPDAVDPHVNLALCLAIRNQFDEALREYRRALEINSDSINAHRGLAFLLTRMGRADEARTELERTILLDPNSAPAHADLAVLLLKRGDTNAARSHFEAALAIDPNNQKARSGLGKLLHNNAGQAVP